ncbi:MAG: RNA-binding protein lsm5 [Chaenotheca gracillima]|nr:MAG: RNA-binding protein lsm5 [Chaenotheca gracillima]
MRILHGMSSFATLVLSFLLGFDLFISYAAAQDDLPTLTNTDANNAMPTAKSETAAPKSSGKGSKSASAKPASKSASPTAKSAATSKASASESKKGVTITGSTAKGTDSAALTSLSSSGADPSSIPLPTIAGQYSYPPPSVPPTAKAPFMQHSNLPEGTVFIAVGGALAFLAVCVLAWRGLVAWSLHRSVKRAAMQQNISDQKTFYRPPGGKLYSSTAGSTLSIDRLAFGGRGNTAANSQPQRSHTPNESLFFSPTANRGSVAGLDNAGNRQSGYLPAGYYAAGNSAPGGGNEPRPQSGMTQLGSGIMNIGPKSQGYTRAQSMGPSPPGSPGLRPTSQGGDSLYSGVPHSTTGAVLSSSSSVNLNAPPQGRAPSAYLEDLLETHPNRRDSSGRI